MLKLPLYNKTIFSNLGLVCTTKGEAIHYKTVTRKKLLSLSSSEQKQKLVEIYLANLEVLYNALCFCKKHSIRLYRMSSHAFPFADEKIGMDILNEAEFRFKLFHIGNTAKQYGVRIVTHPDQFVVLNSDSSSVIENSIKILTTQARIMDKMKLPKSSWSLINIHGGKGNRKQKLIENIKKLPDSVYSRLTLENDERVYGSQDIFEICQAATIPMVFDAHHHLVKEKLNSYDHPSMKEAVALARLTWKKPEWQLVHISNGKEHLHDNKHSNLITSMPSSFQYISWIEVEAKGKEESIFHLRQSNLSWT